MLAPRRRSACCLSLSRPWRSTTGPARPWSGRWTPGIRSPVIYTSGTTGPSKGVLSSYLHIYTNAGPETWHFVKGNDRFLVNMPLFHIGGMGIIFVMLARGGSIAVMENFSTEGFWPFVRETRTTCAFLLGVMATFLLKAPPSPQDRDHSLRLAFMVPFTETALEMHERFGYRCLHDLQHDGDFLADRL